MNEDLRYPIGKFQWPETISPEERLRHIQTLAGVSARMREAVSGLSKGQLDTPYREGGWTVRQVVHHVPDSHMNAFIRTKLALTEAEPTIKPYDEAAWALLGDVAATPIDTSLQLLESLHERWVALLRGLSEAEWKKRFLHPERGPVSLEDNLALYAWHCHHHVEHIQALRRRNGW